MHSMMNSSRTRTLPITPGHRRLSRRVSHAGASFRRSQDATTAMGGPSSTPFDLLAEPLAGLAQQFETMQDNFEMMKGVNDSLVGFNKAFSGFLFGLSVNGECVDWSEVRLHFLTGRPLFLWATLLA